jgi:biotin transport system substrate-specific component
MPLPYTPVPVTWQVAGVLFAGLVLAPRAAFASQGLYVLAGCAGTPVFAQHVGGVHIVLGSTGGYLLSYPFAAMLVSLLAGHAMGRPAPARQFGACVAGIAVIYLLGCVQLALVAHLSAAQAVVLGAGVFVLWDLAKALLVVGIVQRGGRRLLPLGDESGVWQR